MPMKPDTLVETPNGLGVTFIDQHGRERRGQVWVRMVDTGVTVQFDRRNLKVIDWDE